MEVGDNSEGVSAAMRCLVSKEQREMREHLESVRSLTWFQE